MIITTEQLKELRDATGISVMQCKKALEEAEGSMEKALMILKKKSSDIAAKKADREVSNGSIVIKKADGKVAVVTLLCETDFVSQNDEFMAVANTIADEALKNGAESAKTTSTDMINSIIQKVGENIKLENVEILTGSTLGAYVHNGKAGVVVSLTGGTEELARDIALHVAAMKPEYLKKDDVPAEKLALARELFEKEVNESDKPADIKAKMLQGKIDTYFKEQTLLDQPFVKNPDMTIGTLVKNAGASIDSFKRYTI
jgi:elongation factor Ts